MNIQTLPDDLFPKQKEQVLIYNYYISDPCIKNKVNLTKNVISFLVEGTKELITHDKTTTIDNANFLVIKAGNCLMSENLSPSNRYHSMLFFFDNEILLNFVEKHKIFLQNKKENKPYHVCNYDAYTRNFVNALQQINHYPSELQHQLLAAKFEEIMFYLIHKKGIDFVCSLVDFQNDQAQHFKNVVESNILNILTLQELAFLCNMSLSTFKREFEKHYQASPMKWLVEQRLEHSAFLLSTQQQRPSDIFQDIGFETLSSFIQAFKSKFDKTPKQYQLEKMNF